MNFLAHAYLSFNDPSLTVGNMIADFVKGKQILQFDEAIQRGIRLHRAIDTFTDQHPATIVAKNLFRPSCRLYGAVFMDIVYDHYLANDPQHFTPQTLEAFAASVYQILENNTTILPDKFKQVLYYMQLHNWLYNYRTREGMLSSFKGIVRRSAFIDFPATVPFAVFETHYEELGQCYATFFPDIQQHVRQLIS
jgi:acyl carrier protein phosphodiesterase